MSWLDQLVGALAGGAEAGANFYNKRQQQQREDEELKLQRVRQAKLDQMAEDQAAWTRSQGERANERQDRLDTEAAGEKALGRAVEISELNPPRPLSPTVAAPLAKAGMPLKGLSFSMPALDGGAGFTAGPGTTVQANDPARNIGMMRGWQTADEKAEAKVKQLMEERMTAISSDPSIPAPLRRMLQAAVTGLPTSNTNVSAWMTPEEQKAAADAETAQQIRLDNARTANERSLIGARETAKKTAADDSIAAGDPKTVELLDLSLAAIEDIKPGSPGYGSAVGFGINQVPFASDERIAGTDAGDFRTRFKNFEALQVLPKLSFMKGLGQMSNMEFDNMRNASAALKTTLTEKEYARQWEIMKTNLQKARNRAMAGTTYINDPDGDGRINGTSQPTVDIEYPAQRPAGPPGRQFIMRSGGGQ